MLRVATLIITILCVTQTASAQSTADLLRRAYELRLSGHDEAALPLLQQAYAINPSPGIAAQLGLGEQSVGLWDDAGRHLHDALAVPNDPWVARHIEALEGAYTLVLAHFPREASARPMTAASEMPSAAPAAPAGNTGSIVADRVVRRENHAGMHTDASSLRTLGYSGVVIGGIFLVGGFASWAARETIVGNFNRMGCRVGDPMPAAECDQAKAIAGRDATTAIAVTGLVVGGLVETAGVAMMLLEHRRVSWPQRRFAVTSGPGDVGVGVVVGF